MHTLVGSRELLCATSSTPLNRRYLQDFSASPVVKTLLSQSRGTDLVPGRGTKIPHVAQFGLKKNKGDSLHITLTCIFKG